MKIWNGKSIGLSKNNDKFGGVWGLSDMGIRINNSVIMSGNEENPYLNMTHSLKDDLIFLLLMSCNLRPALGDNNSWEVNQCLHAQI